MQIREMAIWKARARRGRGKAMWRAACCRAGMVARADPGSGGPCGWRGFGTCPCSSISFRVELDFFQTEELLLLRDFRRGPLLGFRVKGGGGIADNREEKEEFSQRHG